MNSGVRVTFFQVKKIEEKQNHIIRLAEEYFEKKEPLLIQLPHEKALEYVDCLLWKVPKDSFLPHSIKTDPTQDLIVLTTPSKNPNNALSLLNLCPEPANSSFPFIKIYEFEDLVSANKNHLAQKRYKAYKDRGYKIITI